MTTTRFNRLDFLVALSLFAITLISWFIFDLGKVDALSPNSLSAAVLVLAAIKAQLILIHFMELRRAPLGLRLLFNGWLLVVGSALAAFMLVW